MKALMSSVINPWQPPHPKLRIPVVCCSTINGSSSSSSEVNLQSSQPQECKSSNDEEPKQSEIWRLFREAQKNILHLNQHRLKAVENLNKINIEKQLLVDRIEQLELEKKTAVAKPHDRLSMFWELLLRIDSMVLMGMKSDAEILAELRHFSERNQRNGFHIVHVCTEMAPLVSVGSLASYVTGLSCALQRKGHLVEVILPKYSNLDLNEVQGLQEIEAECYSYFNGQLHGNRIWTGVVYGIGVTLIQPLYYSSFFNRERVYGYSDDFERFTYFSRASLDYIVKSGKQPDVIHIHNWETAIIGPLFWDIMLNRDLKCLEHPEKLALCGLDPARLHRSDRLQDTTKAHLKQSGYAPCGFDNSTWDPSTDKFLPQQYSVKDMKGKAVCKAALQQHLGFSEHASTILVGCIFSEVSDVDLENLRAVFGKLGGLMCRLYSICSVSFSFFLIISPGPKGFKVGAAPIAVNSNDDGFRNFVEHDYETTNFSRFISSTFGNMSITQALDEIRNNPSKWKRKIMDAMEMDFSWDAECCDIHASAYTAIKNL
ncbi:unnamed protein product [Prunus armeniaca]|uniref:starch synthase n=1 Tax=Prunus armeniaca TaxID=36596 RepID=A0A6J5XPR6_PRUAR|nr:unnamed protein product [Prunus armeniaca]